ncbi:MAG TPA: hypothetical protein VJN71_11025 [Nitrososphaerales archaeon]|nr:hypothetical protein [Nitrososphaerales archaeon]
MSFRHGATLGILFLLVVSPFFIPIARVTSSTGTSSIVPVWAFQGAYTNYTVTETAGNITIDSGWESYTVTSVDLTSGTFNLTVKLYDLARIAAGQGLLSANETFPLFGAFGFSAVNSTQLAMLNSGVIPGGGPNQSITTNAMVSVKAGTFSAVTVMDTSGENLVWIDSYSGVILKSGITQPNQFGQLNRLLTELASTNVPMSSIPSFDSARVAVSITAGIFLVIGLLISFGIRRGNSVKRARDALPETI